MINLDITSHNANLLFNDLVKRNSQDDVIDKGRNLTVDSEGRLSTISCWNLIGRLIKWISNLDGSVDRQVNATVLKTLKDINEHNLKHIGDGDRRIRTLFYLTRRAADDEFTIWDAEAAYSSSYPADYLDCIAECAIFHDIAQEIREATSKIFRQSNYPINNHLPANEPNEGPRVWRFVDLD